MPPVAPRRLRAIRIAELRARLLRIRARERVVVMALLVHEEEQAEEEERARGRRPERRPRSVWVKPWLARRPLLGTYDNLIQVVIVFPNHFLLHIFVTALLAMKLKLLCLLCLLQELIRESASDFKGFMRMEVNMFQELVDRVGPRVQKNTNCREPLAAGLKIALTLRFLATGESYHSLGFQFRIGHNTASLFVPQVCDAIREEYEAEQFTTPSTPAGWLEVEKKFSVRWNWHHCCGALDGKHVKIVKPKHGGSNYYCFKGFHSIILMALVDADYKFIWTNVGTPGSESDAGVYNVSTLEPALREDTLGLPPPAPLPNDDRDTPYFMVGDDAFALRKYMQKPFCARHLTHDERIFNYRCSRGRRVVENAFGILASRWRFLHTPIMVNMMKCDVMFALF